MKKNVVAQPNLLLKEERELRGWSQRYVADAIGADRYYLSRWEHGTASPSPYYRQKLCELFGKNARELGMIARKSQKGADVSEEETGEREQSRQKARTDPLFDPLLPAPRSGASRLIGRDAVLQQIQAKLSANENGRQVALYGLPGVGKTTLAIELAHDKHLQEHFKDGILWAGLGPTPDILALAHHWGTLLNVPPQQIARLDSVTAWAKVLHQFIGQRQMLLVLDDVWQIETAFALKVGGPLCAYLITTRFPGVALHFLSDASEPVALHELDTEDGLALLTHLAPEVVRNEPEAARALVEAVGGLPLALTLMGKYLRVQQHAGQKRRVRAALERLQNTAERLQLTGPLSPLERSSGWDSEASLSLQTVIALSDRQLEEQEQAALRTLSLFPPKPNSFSEEAAVAVSGVPVEVLDGLSDAGLLESSNSGRYTLHQTIADYAKLHLTDSAAFTRMAEFYTGFVTRHQSVGDFDLLEQEVQNIFAALEVTYTHQQAESFVGMVNALFSFLLVRGIYAQEMNVFLQRAVQLARTLNDEVTLATALVYQGKAAFQQGKFALAEESLQEGRKKAERLGNLALQSDALMSLGTLARFNRSSQEAETYLQESLKLARQIENNTFIGDVLGHLGSVFSDQGRYKEAEAYNLEGLTIARAMNNPRKMATILANLCSIAFFRGEYGQGDKYGLEALALARQIGFSDLICMVLTNLGSSALDQKDYARAETSFGEALTVARSVNDPRIISTNLASLGNLCRLQGKLVEAQAYLREALEIARQMGDIWLISAVLAEYGEYYLQQNQLDAASAAFYEVAEIAVKVSQEAVASAFYGLARVAHLQGNLLEAQQKGQESLALFEAMDHHMKETLKAWLSAL